MGKTPLILCPGLLNDAALWRHQSEMLADRVEAQVADLTVADSIADLATAVLETAPPRFALAGLSMGGYVAFEILRRAPERVERLALLNTSARPDTPESAARRHEMIDIVRRDGFAKLPYLVMSSQLHPDSLCNPVLTASITAMAERVGPDGFIRQQTAIMGRADSRPGLAAIACPTVVICGRQDKLTGPDIMGEIAEGIPGAKFVAIDGAGHLTPMERPEAVSAVLEYWLQD